jgi:hypothetical protein
MPEFFLLLHKQTAGVYPGTRKRELVFDSRRLHMLRRKFMIFFLFLSTSHLSISLKMPFHVTSIFVLHLLNYQSHVNCINLDKKLLESDIIPFLPQSLIIQHQQTLCYFMPIDSTIR